MMTKLLTGWHFMRWLRLAAGMLMAWQAYVLADSMYGFIAGFFLLQAITDTGCCGAATCQTNTLASDKKQESEPDFEIIKQK